VGLLVERVDGNADSKDDTCRTPLSWAAINGHEEVVRLLVERVDVNAYSKDEHGQTPLSWAERTGYHANVWLLGRKLISGGPPCHR